MNRFSAIALAAATTMMLSACESVDWPDFETGSHNAQSGHSSDGGHGAQMMEAPEFAAFPTGDRFEGAPSPVDLLSHQLAWQHRDALVSAARTGPDFAGIYTVASWSCGVNCEQFALVDARDGKVIWGPSGVAGADYRLDSQLLVINPPEAVFARFGNQVPPGVRTEYYVWTGLVLQPWGSNPVMPEGAGDDDNGGWFSFGSDNGTQQNAGTASQPRRSMFR